MRSTDFDNIAVIMRMCEAAITENISRDEC